LSLVVHCCAVKKNVIVALLLYDIARRPPWTFAVYSKV